MEINRSTRRDYIERIRILTNLYLMKTETELLELYKTGRIYDYFSITPTKRKRIGARSFYKDLKVVKNRLTPKIEEQSPEEILQKREKWRRRLEKEIEEAKSDKQRGMIVSLLKDLMRLDGVFVDIPISGDTFVFNFNQITTTDTNQLKEKAQILIQNAKQLQDKNEILVIEEK